MDPKAQKEQELLVLIENLEKSYDQSSPGYKFRYVFYNRVDVPFTRPADFPEALWSSSLTGDPAMMPVLLKGEEVEQRKAMQVDVCSKVNESYGYLQRRISGLRMRSEKLRSRMEGCASIYRKTAAGVYNKYKKEEERCALMDEIYRIDVALERRSKLCVSGRKGEALDYLCELKSMGEELLKRVDEKLQEKQKQSIIRNELDKYS
jgi:hypothetical protein